MGVSSHKRSDFCLHCLLEPKAAIISKNTSQVIKLCHAKVYSICYFSFSDTRDHILRMPAFLELCQVTPVPAIHTRFA